MAVAQASRVRVEQHGDATFGLREEYLIDTETGLLVKRETLVAAVPVEGGKTALIVGQKTTAAVAESEDKVFVGQPKTAAAPVAKAADKVSMLSRPAQLCFTLYPPPPPPPPAYLYIYATASCLQ